MPPPPCRWRDRIEIRKIRGNFRIRKFPRTPSKNFEKARSDLFICRGDHWSLLRVCTEIPQRTALIKPSPVGEGGTRSVTDEVLPRMKCDAYASTTQKRPPCWVVFRVVETTVNPPLRGSGIQNACAYSDAGSAGGFICAAEAAAYILVDSDAKASTTQKDHPVGWSFAWWRQLESNQ